MQMHQPQLTVEAHAKRQRLDCPHCGTTIPVEEKMECSCGATYKFKLSEVCGPSFES